MCGDDIRRCALWIGVGARLAFAPLAAPAQQGVVRGTVVDLTGTPVRDADVSIVSIHRLTRSDSLGRFELTRLDAGTYELSVRRLGFVPQDVTVVVSDAISYAYRVVLDAQPAEVPGVSVSAENQRLRLGIEDFYRRRARGAGGSFFMRQDIADRHAKLTSDVLRTAPGIRLVRTRNGQAVRFVGGSSLHRECVPDLWLDGQLARGLEADQVPVNDIEGIEVYSGPSTTPMQFSHAQARDACGVIVIWTRIPGSG
jgi:hypothetical protein